ncbi:RT0821/Lpp0805 family surface protein [Microvirga sp.]|uniref:RT0821/Lpp0805 family surface protein n=1 Tax=Microvirga sp. TaxID=1873136 RepID=UPI0028A74307|nr:RT0821/Lpp0805 family surface protein [Microvirga sp.]
MTWIDPRRYRSDARISEALKVLAAGLIALSTGACGMSLGLSALDEDGPKATGAIASKSDITLSAYLDEEDWRRAKAALAVALDPQGPGTQVSWDNPATTRKGTFTPVGAPFVKNDEICRSFSAHLSGPSVSALQGTACRPSGSEWTLKEVKPLKGSAKV